MAQTLYKRLIIDEIALYLSTDDVIVLHGARQVGKTSILYYLKNFLDERKSVTHYIDLEDSRFAKIIDAGIDAFLRFLKEEGLDSAFFKSQRQKLFVFIDEIQYLDNPSSFLKLMNDHHREIKLIVSGSSTFQIKNKFKDSLVGRTINFEIFNLSFQEFLMFKEIPFIQERVYTKKKLDELVALYEEYALYGGYPKIVLTPTAEMKEKYLQQIIDTYVRKDIRDLAAVRDVNKFNQLLEVLASQGGQLLNITEISNTVGISKQTVEDYLFLLEQTYVLRLVRPYSRNIRSELTKTPKIFFYDTGLMQMLWLKELPKELLGQVFETSVFAELVKRYGLEKIAYWRTMDKKEIDFIIKIKEKLIPIEAKLNFSQSRLTAVNYFTERYHVSEFFVTGLFGETKNKFHIYPWQMRTIF